MKYYDFLTLIILLGFLSLSAIAEQTPDSDDSQISALYSQANQDRVILLGFKDASINRLQLTTSANLYRSRGDYRSSTWSKRIGTQIAEKYALTELSAWPVTELGIHCIVYQLPESMSMEQALQTMAQDKRLKVVQRMRFYRTRAHYSDPYFKLQSQIQAIQIEALHRHSTGKNITIALIDTGVDLKHPDLRGQVADKHNYASAISPGFVNDLHGTAVAGIMVAQANNGTGIVGIAPDATLLALKACWPVETGDIDAVCNSLTLALAINQAIRSKVDILNLSLAGDKDPLLETLINKAIERGIVVVAATDEAKMTKGIHHAGNFPACMPGVIAVRNNRLDKKSILTDPAVMAPGTEVLTTFPKGAYDFISGSSLSAAHVSGIIALLLERHANFNVNQIITLLKSTKMSELHQLFGLNKISMTTENKVFSEINPLKNKSYHQLDRVNR